MRADYPSMKTYLAEIKEVGEPTVLTPSITCDGMTKEGLIEFWGLNEPDVEWFGLYEIVEGHRVELCPFISFSPCVM